MKDGMGKPAKEKNYRIEVIEIDNTLKGTKKKKGKEEEEGEEEDEEIKILKTQSLNQQNI